MILYRPVGSKELELIAQSGFKSFPPRLPIQSIFYPVLNFEVQTVGGARVHQELWIPAEELDEFNTHIIGDISIEAAYCGDNFSGEIDSQTHLPSGLQ